MRSIMKDKIANTPIAQVSIADVERWHTRLRRGGMQDGGIRNQHGSDQDGQRSDDDPRPGRAEHDLGAVP